MSIEVAALLLPIAHLAGAVCAFRAAQHAHTAQGAVAWAISLVALPYLALPAYAFLRPGALRGEAEKWREQKDRLLGRVDHAGERRAGGDGMLTERRRGLIERLADLPVQDGCSAELLIDGEACFEAAFDVIDRAERYVLVCFYIMRTDGIGQRLKARMLARARAGVEVTLLYDALGARTLTNSYLGELREAGVKTRPFAVGSRLTQPFRLNYRNHRKLVVADGRDAFLGGPNIGDEYLGLDATYGAWRDTAVRLGGPCVTGVQLAFAQDWRLAGGRELDLDWAAPAPRGEGCPAIVLPTGPADALPACSLFFCHMIAEASERVWIASPYFVPDLDVLTALKMAALRGVDVRVLIADRVDHWIVWLAAFAYVEETNRAGIRLFRYTEGFMHQKAMVVDDWAAAVGTANLDNRSLHLNFEITAIAFDRGFAGSVARMLEADFARSYVYDRETHARRGALLRVAAPAARLFAPLL